MVIWLFKIKSLFFNIIKVFLVRIIILIMICTIQHLIDLIKLIEYTIITPDLLSLLQHLVVLVLMRRSKLNVILTGDISIINFLNNSSRTKLKCSINTVIAHILIGIK